VAEATVTKDATATKEAAEKKKSGPASGHIWGTGRRKSSVARVRIGKGDGKFSVNRRPYGEYFPLLQDKAKVEAALVLVGAKDKVDVFVNVEGGGPTGQAGAIAMGLARALRKYDSAYEDPLRLSGLLTRDSRMKERKKYGRRGARRGFQFSKR
jgi:small subunit ribosomal protein S9